MMEILYSPVTGQVVHLEQVNDDMFAQKMLGDGAAILPGEKKVYSPANGTITIINESQHAIGIKTRAGTEILIHIGLDTVLLKGVPFSTKVNTGDSVQKGDLLTIVDLPYIQAHGCDTIVPILAFGKQVKPLKTGGEITAGDPLFEIEA